MGLVDDRRAAQASGGLAPRAAGARAAHRRGARRKAAVSARRRGEGQGQAVARGGDPGLAGGVRSAAYTGEVTRIASSSGNGVGSDAGSVARTFATLRGVAAPARYASS